MKPSLPIVICALAVALFVPLARATQYTIDWPPYAGSEAFHDEVRVFQYTPGAGWTTGKSVFGQDTERGGGGFTILADDGSNGQAVDVQFNLSIDFKATFSTDMDVKLALGDDWASKESNFAGLTSGELSTTLFVSSLFGPVLLTSDSWNGAASDLTLTAPAAVGYNRGIGLMLDHPNMVPTGLQVIDPTKPAGFGVEIIVRGELTGANVVNVPDSSSTLALLLGISLPALAILRFRLSRWPAHA